MSEKIDRLIGLSWKGETGPKLQEAYDAALVETLEQRIKQLEEVTRWLMDCCNYCHSCLSFSLHHLHDLKSCCAI